MWGSIDHEHRVVPGSCRNRERRNRSLADSCSRGRTVPFCVQQEASVTLEFVVFATVSLLAENLYDNRHEYEPSNLWVERVWRVLGPIP